MTPPRAPVEPEVPVVVEVDDALPWLASAAELALPGLAVDLADLIERVGLTGRPVPTVEPVPSTRALRIRVHGALQPYDQRLARQVWLAAAPERARDAALSFEQEPEDAFPDGWLRRHAEGSADPESLSGFVRRFTVEVVARRASCLVGDEQVAEYAALAPAVPEAAAAEAELGEVLRTLLGLGVWAIDRAAVASAIQDRAGREAADVAETLMARLRPRRVEIHANPRTLATLLPSPSRSESIMMYAAVLPDHVRGKFQATEEFVYLDTGLRLPDLFWVPSEQVGEEIVAVRVNDLVGVGFPLPPEGKVLVDAPPSSLGGVAAEPALGPAGPSALIDEDEAGAVHAQGYTTLDRLGVVQHFVFTELLRNAPRLLSVRDVEVELHRMGQPDLVRAVLEDLSIGDLTRVLRELLDGGLSIRDLATVLERLLRFDTIDVDADACAVFDERLALSGPVPATPLARARTLARYVREGMAAFIGSRFSFGSETLVAYLLHPEFERLALEVAPDDLEGEVDRPEAEAALEALRDVVWRELSLLPLAAAKPALLTSRRARTAVRRVLAPELPDQRVVRHSEIPADINVMPVARIGAPALVRS